ncbi:MAG: glutamate synthase subunit beta [Solirubrobacteraceae bacterium]
MGQLRGFLEIARGPTPQRDPGTRIADYGEVYSVLPAHAAAAQGARCMDCGVPFCHDGCPLGNLIPDWNDLISGDRWHDAMDQLHATNNFPEFTGRICPAPCEAACVLAINDDAVAIKQVEVAIAERAFREGWVTPQPPPSRTGSRVAVIGSGPAGLAAAAELNRAGHRVVIYERDEAPGGLMRFGIPDFKLEKWVIDRRMELLVEEGVEVCCDAEVGGTIDAAELSREVDAIVVATGARVPRQLPLPGRDLEGVHLAMDYLYGCNRWVAEREGRPARPAGARVTAAGRDVVVIGGGDTAMDCVGNAHRERARSVTVIDTYEPPAGVRTRDIVPWPQSPKRLASTYALDEGGERLWQRTATELIGVDGRVAGVRGARAGPPPRYPPIAGAEFELPADLVLIAIGFAGVERGGAIEQLGLGLDARGNIHAPAFSTSRPAVFAAGDARRGQSLVVWAIAEGRRCARVAQRHLAQTR